MKKLKKFDEWMNEGVLPDWVRPTSDLTANVRGHNLLDHQDTRQSMTRFTEGDKIVELSTGVEGKISSMGDGMNTITWYCDGGMSHDSYAQDLDKIVG